MGNRTNRGLTLVGLAFWGLWLAGCGGEEATSVEDIRKSLAERAPPGWKVAYAKDAGIECLPPTKGDDLVMYKADAVKLQVLRAAGTQPGSAAETTGHLHFTLSPRPFIKPDDFAKIFAEHDELRKEHARCEHRVEMVPRNTKGELMPRGTVESLEVAAYREAKAKLAPYDPEKLPTHSLRGLAVRVYDWRPKLLPVDRDLQQEYNTAFVAIAGYLKPYKP
jgi:hypothetical protein